MTPPDDFGNWKPRELQIIQLLAQGFSNREIGARLHLSDQTIHWYNKQIFSKLAVSNRTQAVTRARALGLLNETEQTGPLEPAQIAARPAVRYVANGDVHIAYQVLGSGPFDLLFIHGFISHLELAWENDEYEAFFRHLARFARVILFDKRGIGLSDRIQTASSLENTIEDARCVLDAVGSERAFVMGTSEGGAAAVLLAAIYPQRVHGLILVGALPKVISNENEPAWAVAPEQFDAMIEQMQQEWGGQWAVESFAPSRSGDHAFRAWWARVLRAASSPSSIKAVLLNMREIDIRPLLPQIGIRTLIIHKTGDRIAPVDAGRYFADHMPYASWVELPGDDHVFFVESKGILAAIAAFCRQTGTENPAGTWIATILNVKPGGHALWEEKLQAEIALFNPRAIIPHADGSLALFESPSRALQCALRLGNKSGIPGCRIGLHVGACREVGNQPLEPVLETIRRAAHEAQEGQIVVTQTLYDMLAGSGFLFTALDRSLRTTTGRDILLFSLD